MCKTVNQTDYYGKTALYRAIFGYSYRCRKVNPDCLPVVQRLLGAGAPELARCGERLSRTGGHALITGGDEDGAAVVNRGFVAGRLAQTYEWPRVPGVFHGSGCTLASAIAARLACGDATERALAQAQDYTWRAIEHGFAAGRGQRIPDRRPLP